MQNQVVGQKKVVPKFVAFVLVLGLVLSIVAVGTPNLLSARKSANESSAVGSLRTINTALISYSGKTASGGYPQKLSDLYADGYIDQNLGSGRKSGYDFRYKAIDSDGDGVAEAYEVEAVPLQPGTTGLNTYKTDESAVILAATTTGGRMRTLDGEPAPKSAHKSAEVPATTGRMVTRGSCLDLIVAHPDQVAAQVRVLTAQLGGYVESARLADQGSEQPTGEMKIRVPAARYEEARELIRGLGRRAGEETDNTRDVTSPYVDLEATLRNYRAEEAQYLEIMRRAGSIKDTLQVAEKLADVRGRIERSQGELNVMSQQVAMASLSVTLRTEAVVQATEVRWHPVAEVKAAFWSGADNLKTYANFMFGVLFQLPVMLLWIATVLAAIVISWRTLRWTWRRFFAELPAAA